MAEKLSFQVAQKMGEGPGAWLPYNDEMKKMLKVAIISSDDLAEAKEKRERKQLEALLAKYGK